MTIRLFFYTTLSIFVLHLAACGLDPLGRQEAIARQKQLRDSTVRATTALELGKLLKTDSLVRLFGGRNTTYAKEKIDSLYFFANKELLWQDQITQKPLPALKKLTSELNRAAENGLNPNSYRVKELDELYQQTYLSDTASYDSARIGNMVKLDAMASAAAIVYATDLLRGRIKPTGWDMQYRDAPLAQQLQKAIADSSLTLFFAQTEPKYPTYSAMKKQLASLPDDKIDLARLNMERFRWLPDPEKLGKRYIWVNIPEFFMRVIQDGDTSSSIKVVVGEPKNASPVLANKPLRNVIFSPVWNVPVDIAYEEIEYILKNPAVLIVADVDVWVSGKKVDPRDVDWTNVNRRSVRMRQRPKATNSMGRVKFPFDNNHGVYIHDTPNQYDFGLTTRATSHGCVRVQEPEKLASEMLKGSNWTQAAMRKAMFSGKQQYANLPQNVSVNFVYFTAWARENGTWQYAKDVYGHDKRQLKALKAEL